LAGTTIPIGTRTGIGIGRNWVKKGSEIGNSLEFSRIPLGIHNQATMMTMAHLKSFHLSAGNMFCSLKLIALLVFSL
jgi:hypothetical protein